ncbi:MAG TPA: mechanosensitive ion channel domain-containing protein [Pirellulales bacterium]|nr:mechanosensitive ion channel domain-containing protein [Pirellulales bacterium]
MALSTFLLADAVVETTDANIFDKSKDALQASFSQAWQQVFTLAPRIVAMVAVLVIGYVIARLVARVITLASEKLGLQVAAERSGLAESMAHTNIGRNVPAIVGTIVFWLLMCVFIMAAFNILGLQSVTDAMQRVVDYIPRLLAATVVVVVGLLAASFLRGLIATSADRVGLPYAEHLANASYYVLAFITLLAVCTQLGLQLDLLQNLILIASAGLALGFGLAFGLGGRDVMAGILAGYYIRQRLHAGDSVTVGMMEGTVREVGPVATIIETEEDGLLNRRSIPNTKMLNEAVR